MIIPVIYGHISQFNKEAQGLRVSGLQILRFEAADPLAIAMPFPSYDDGFELAKETNPFNLEHMRDGWCR